jgi:hypothetical protein
MVGKLWDCDELGFLQANQTGVNPVIGIDIPRRLRDVDGFFS